MMYIRYKFNKIDDIFSLEVKTLEDSVNLAEKILEDKNQIIHTFLSTETEDFEFIHDFLELIESIKEYGGKKYSKQYKDLIYLLVSICLSLKNESLSSILIQRLYTRGFVLDLVDSYIKYYNEVVDSKSVEEFDKVCVLGINDTSLSLCSNVLRNLSKFLFVKYYEGEYYLCVDSFTHYNMIRRAISHILYSSYNVNNEWNYVSLSKLFHPLSKLYLPCLILYLLIDELPDLCKIPILSNLSSFYCDSELMRTIGSDDVISLAGCISRLLVCTEVNRDEDLCCISCFLTKAITSGLSTLDPIIRESAMTIAESYSEFTYNNSKNKDETLIFKFDRDYKLDTPSMFNLACFRSKINVNPNFMNKKNNNGINTDSDPKTVANKPVENDDKYQKNLNNNENETFLEFIFKGVPKIGVKTINGYVKEAWITPPAHIVQCYERLLSKPARGDVEYECLIANSLDRVEEESVENKILRISQTLLYLPQVINKNESIMEKYSIPLSNILIKLDDLDLYREKIEEIVNCNDNRRLVYETGNEDIEIPSKFISKDPEILVLVSLVLLTYHCPMSITQFYTSHLFDSEYSLGIRITMLLCIQYTAVAFNALLDPNQLVDKIIQDTSKLAKETQSISNLKACNPLEDKEYKKIHTDIVLTPTNDESLKPQSNSFQISTVFVRKFNNQAMSLLLDSLDLYLKRKQNERPPMDEDIVVGIFETLVILVSSCFVDQEILKDLHDIIRYFENKPIGQRLRNTLDMVSMIMYRVPNYRL